LDAIREKPYFYFILATKDTVFPVVFAAKLAIFQRILVAVAPLAT
jgi:hypothetical protein